MNVTSDPVSTGSSKDTLESLCGEYCPPLEAGLVYALASDFNLEHLTSVQELRKTLNELRESAVVEQDLELLPPDLGIVDNHKVDGANQENASSHPSRSSPRSTTEDDTVTSVTTGISGLRHTDVEDNDTDHASGYGEAGIEFETLSQTDKCKWFCKMFPQVKIEDVNDVVARCEGNFDRSTDELLNISFLKESSEDHGDQEYVAPKGIDGFLQDGGPRKKGRSKARKQKNRSGNKDLSETWGSDSGHSSGTATPNVWKDLPEDVEFIASRTQLKPKIITSFYHANGLRLAPTIRALAHKEGEIYKRSSHRVDDIIEWQMDELRANFTTVPDSQIYGVLMLANKLPSAAKELLDLMISSNEQPVLLGKVTGLASYTPINLSEDEGNPKRGTRSALPTTVPASSGVYTTSHLSNSHGQAATQAFQQASAAYRRGKSDHLMGGAAAYYASIGHEEIKAAKAIQAAAANAHVAAQSSSTVLDLHGVNISDAVRIAQDGTEAWWEGLGDRKYLVGGRGDGYRIVTGVGRHSSDGIGRIGPAVSKMLVREGWKVEVGRGEIVVSGKARK